MQAADGSGEGVLGHAHPPRLASSTLDNFPISRGDYTLGDLVIAADDGDGHLYITGLAERRFRDSYLRCEAIDVDGPQATVRHRAIAEHLESSGVLLESLIAGWYGAAVPVGMSGEALAELLASAPYPIREETEGDTHVRA